MDDFSIYEDTFDLCFDNLAKVLYRCEEQLGPNLGKMPFYGTRRCGLGHIVSHRGIEVDKAKMEVIESLPSPTCIEEVRSYFGHGGFYRRFIKDFFKIVKPLTLLLAKDIPFVFINECLEAFHKIK